MTEDNSSILIVVGRQDTGELEAQIRGSRHAWDVRLISVDRLLHLMRLKKEIEDLSVVHKIGAILRPQEFTRVDGIVDLVFSTAQDLQQNEEVADPGSDPSEPDADKIDGPNESLHSSAAVQFNHECIARIEKYVKQTLVKQSKTIYTSPDGALGVSCAVSRENRRSGLPSYWYGFHRSQQERLATSREAYVSFGCGSPEVTLLIPRDDFISWLDGLNTTIKDDRLHYHVRIVRQHGGYVLLRKGGYDSIDVTKYLLGSQDSQASVAERD